MAYRKHRYDPDAPRPRRKPLRFAGTFDDEVQETTVPMLVASRLLDEIGFNELIDTEVDWDTVQWTASPGDRSRAVVLCGFGGGRRPAIQRIAETFEDVPLDILFDDVPSADVLNRYAIADTLDAIHDAGCARIFNQVASRVRVRWRIITEIIHSDTTAQRVWGVYERDPEADGSVIDITYGYPKGFPEGLRQYMVGMAVGDHGLPMVGSVLDGNTDDTEWYLASMDMMEDLFLEEDPIYVADAHLAEAPVIERMLRPRRDGRPTRFITRCPKSFDDRLQDRVLAMMDEADLVGHSPEGKEGRVTYEVAEYPVKVLGTDARAIVSRNVRDAGKGARVFAEEVETFRGKVSKLATTYEREDAAKRALVKLKRLSEKAPFDIRATAVPCYVERVRPGRRPRDPSKVPRDRVWRVEAEVVDNPEKERMIVRRAEVKVFITNVATREDDPERGRSASEVLDIYHGEWRVEGAFRSLKAPPIADALYLNRPERAEALITLLNVVILLRGLIQYIMRLHLSAIPDEELPLLGRDRGRLQRNVTADYFIQKCERCRLRYDPDDGTFRVRDREGAAGFFLGLLEMPLESILGRWRHGRQSEDDSAKGAHYACEVVFVGVYAVYLELVPRNQHNCPMTQVLSDLAVDGLWSGQCICLRSHRPERRPSAVSSGPRQAASCRCRSSDRRSVRSP